MVSGTFVDAALDLSSAISHHALRSLIALAYSDELTGLPNRRYLAAKLDDAIVRSRASGEGLSVLVLDIDRFKPINDRYGHAAGDRVLVEFGRVLRATSRATDVMGRWGGEEFLYIHPGPLASAEAQAERLRQAVASFPFGAPELDLRLTVSIGVTEWHPPDENGSDLVDRADWLLYQAKDEGRNRAVSGSSLSLYRWVAATASPPEPVGR